MSKSLIKKGKSKISLLTKKLFRKDAKKPDIQYTIGNISISLPHNHPLPSYQKAFLLYNKAVGIIAQIIEKENSNAIIIDIGANIGDTAAEIRGKSSLHIIAIEGDPLFLTYLKRNTATIKAITIVDSFIGEPDNNSSFKIDKYGEGTAKLLPTTDQEGIKTTTLEEIIEKYNIREHSISLIKIDTDGFDFRIIRSMDTFIAKIKPSIFFEYDIHFDATGAAEGMRTINRLSELGYNFVVYDNFGNLLTCIRSNSSERFQEINNYLRSCFNNKGGINYVDILAIHKENALLLKGILDAYNSN